MNTPPVSPDSPESQADSQQPAEDVTKAPPGPAPRPSTTTPPRPSAVTALRPPAHLRRLAWLAAILYMPVILLGYALYLFGPTACVAGPLCALGDAPGIVQILLLALGFGALYFASARLLVALLNDEETALSGVTRVLRQALHYETIRPLLALFGGVLAVALVAGVLVRTLTPFAFVVGGGVAALLFWLALVGER